MSDADGWDPPIPKPETVRVLHVMVRDTRTGQSLFSGNVQAAAAREAFTAAIRGAEEALMPPSARPVSDGFYTVPGGLGEALQAVADAFLDAQGDDHPVMRVIVVREQPL